MVLIFKIKSRRSKLNCTNFYIETDDVNYTARDMPRLSYVNTTPGL
jgi:hypothetical protein